MPSALRSGTGNAGFTVPAGTPYEAVAVGADGFRNFQDRLTVQQTFGGQDILVDALTCQTWQDARDNPWLKHLPEEVVTYCYQLVPFHKISFVMSVAGDDHQGAADGKGYVVAIFDDRYVRMGPEYAKSYKQAMASVTRG